jgi:two-component system chemotaxis response regulator CheV
MSFNDGEVKRGSILLDTGTNEVEFLEIAVGSERFGVNVAKVSQLLVWDHSKLTQLPSSDNVFLGSYPFRGSNCAVFDLSQILGFELRQDINPLLLVMEFNSRINGFLVDKVFNIERVSWNRFLPISETTFDVTSHSLTGTVMIDKRVIMILDIEALMAELDPEQQISTYIKYVNNESPVAQYKREEVQILYCEDSGVIRKTTVKTLEQAGFRNIEQFVTGAELLRHLQANTPQATTLILSDIEMPELDGLALCKAVKSNPKFQRIPFVFFSSLINDQMRAKCDIVKADAAFCKPEIHMIVDCIDSLLTPLAEGEGSTD